MDHVGHRLLPIRRSPNAELDGLRVALLEFVRLLRDFPGRPAIQMLDYSYFNRLRLGRSQRKTKKETGKTFY